MASAQRLLDAAAPFDPLAYRGDLNLSTADLIAEVLLPSLDRLVSERSPNATLWARTVGGETAEILRDLGGIAIGPRSGESGVCSESLFRDEFVCVMRHGHPLQTGPFTLKRFASAEHVLVAPRGHTGRGVVDDLLEARGLSRRVARVVTGFGGAATLVAASDRVVVVPRALALARRQAEALAVRPVPLEMPKIHMMTMWHEAHDADARLRWFRSLLRDAVRAVGLSPI